MNGVTLRGVATEADTTRQPSNTDSVPYIVADATVRGPVSPLGQQPFQGSIQVMMDKWCDRPWNELYYDDQHIVDGKPTGPTYVYRPAPFTTLDSPDDLTLGFS